MNSFSPDFLERIGMRAAVSSEIRVPTLPLRDILERHLPEGQSIDFMNVDVEGHDYEVLESNDWRRFRPRFIVVEDEVIDAGESDIVRLEKSRLCAVCPERHYPR